MDDAETMDKAFQLLKRHYSCPYSWGDIYSKLKNLPNVAILQYLPLSFGFVKVVVICNRNAQNEYYAGWKITLTPDQATDDEQQLIKVWFLAGGVGVYNHDYGWKLTVNLPEPILDKCEESLRRFLQEMAGLLPGLLVVAEDSLQNVLPPEWQRWNEETAP